MILKEYLDDKRITYREFAGKLGILPQSLQNIVSGKKKPSLDLALKIEELTGIAPKDLIASLNATANVESKRKSVRKHINKKT